MTRVQLFARCVQKHGHQHTLSGEIPSCFSDHFSFNHSLILFLGNNVHCRLKGNLQSVVYSVPDLIVVFRADLQVNGRWIAKLFVRILPSLHLTLVVFQLPKSSMSRLLSIRYTPEIWGVHSDIAAIYVLWNHSVNPIFFLFLGHPYYLHICNKNYN